MTSRYSAHDECDRVIGMLKKQLCTKDAQIAAMRREWDASICIPCEVSVCDVKNKNYRYQQDIADLKERINLLEGAASAAAERLIKAAQAAGIPYVGCDTPEALADRVLELKAALQGDPLPSRLVRQTGKHEIAQVEQDENEVQVQP